MCGEPLQRLPVVTEHLGLSSKDSWIIVHLLYRRIICWRILWESWTTLGKDGEIMFGEESKCDRKRQHCLPLESGSASLENTPAVGSSFWRFLRSPSVSGVRLLPSVKVNERKALLNPNPLSLVLKTTPFPYSSSRLLKKKILCNVIFNSLPSSLLNPARLWPWGFATEMSPASLQWHPVVSSRPSQRVGCMSAGDHFLFLGMCSLFQEVTHVVFPSLTGCCCLFSFMALLPVGCFCFFF